MAGSGWCHHPQRNVTTGAKILVRRNELACRDDWQHSLWESAASEGADVRSVAPRPVPLGPLPPLGADTVRAVLQTPPAMDNVGEDVLLSEARIVAEPRDSRPPAARPAPVAALDTRSAVFRAREAFRDRARSRMSAARHASGAVASDISREIEAAAKAAPGSLAGSGMDSITPAMPFAVGSSEMTSWYEGDERSVAAGFVSQFLGNDDQQEFAEPRGEMAPGPPDRTRDRAAEKGLTDRQRANTVPRESSALGESPEPAPDTAREPRSSKADLPIWFRTDLPRICRSCRDYRPGADGQRGWCANAWAFTHRQMVQADQAAPCLSAIGDWWAPADDVWLVAADVSAHGRPTPLLDRVVASEIVKRRRS